MRRRIRRLVKAGAVCIVFGAFYMGPNERPARAQLFTSIGRALGAPLGGFLDSAATPIIHTIEGSAHNVIDNVDSKVAGQVNRVDKAVHGVLDRVDIISEARGKQVDEIATARLNQADGIMAARIAQVDASLSARISQAMGSLAVLQRDTFKQLDRLVATIDKTVEKRLEEINTILGNRIEQVNAIVRDAIAQVDEVAAARIRQADEVAQRNIGTADVIATKQSLNLQIVLIKVGALIGMIAFLVGALRYTFDNLPKDIEAHEKRKAGSVRWVYAWGLGKWLIHLVVGVLAVGSLSYIANRSTWGPREAQQKLITTNARALDESMAALDFTKVRYFAAQLTVLDPDHENENRALVLRAELVRTVLYRPGLFSSAAGIRQLLMQIDEAERADTATAAGSASPDVIAATCYVRWQLARTRTDELEAAKLCTNALREARGASRFALRSLAARYVSLFLARPIPTDNPQIISEMKALTVGIAPTPLTLLGDASRYDELVLELDRQATEAYVALLQAHAEVQIAARSGDSRKLQDAKVQRTALASDVVKHWTAFDAKVNDDPLLAGSNVVMALFTLNDAPLAQALWFESHQDTTSLAPRVADEPNAFERARMTPVRVAWARRHIERLSPAAKQLAGFEAAKRYLDMEDDTFQFEQAFVSYRVAVGSKAAPEELTRKRELAALAAAKLGLYAKGVPLGTALLDEALPDVAAATPEMRKKVERTNDIVRLRLL